MKPTDQPISSEPTEPKRPAASAKHVFPALELAARPIRARGKDAVEMADGTYRTKDQVIVASSLSSAKKSPSSLTTKLPPRVAEVLRRTQRALPLWAPKAMLGAIALVIVFSIAFFTTVGRDIFGGHAQVIALPKTGTIPADGRNYDVKSAAFQLPDRVKNWSAQVAKSKSGEGKTYTTLDGSCEVELTRVTVGANADLTANVGQTESIALEKMRTLQAEVNLKSITVRALEGDQVYEFVRKRHSYVNDTNQSMVTETAVRTLGTYRLQIVSTCAQSDWDQSESARKAIVDDVRVSIE
jgi:hypothetical protein